MAPARRRGLARRIAVTPSSIVAFTSIIHGAGGPSLRARRAGRRGTTRVPIASLGSAIGAPIEAFRVGPLGPSASGKAITTPIGTSRGPTTSTSARLVLAGAPLTGLVAGPAVIAPIARIVAFLIADPTRPVFEARRKGKVGPSSRGAATSRS